MFFRRNSTGSIPAFTAMMSMCDSRAKLFVGLPGARHAPVARCTPPPKPLPTEDVRWCGML
jgi:hypothetical protein